MSCPSNPKRPVVSGVVPITVLALVWLINGGPIVDPLRVSDGHIPTSLPPQLYCGGLDKGYDVVVPLGGGHGDHLGRVLGAVAGGGDRGGPVSDCGDQFLLLC